MMLIENDPSCDIPERRQAAAPACAWTTSGPTTYAWCATADRPSYLVLNDFYQRGWTARVDGQPARVYIANALFRASRHRRRHTRRRVSLRAARRI